MNEGLTNEEREWLAEAVWEFSSRIGPGENLDAILDECESFRDRVTEMHQWRRRTDQRSQQLYRLRLALEDLRNAPVHEERRLFNRLCRRHLGRRPGGSDA